MAPVFTALALLFSLAQAAVPQGLEARAAIACNRDNCYREVFGSAIAGRSSQGAKDCTSYLQKTVTPCPSTSTSTIIATSIGGTSSTTITIMSTGIPTSATVTITSIATSFTTPSVTVSVTSVETDTVRSTVTTTATVYSALSKRDLLEARATTTCPISSSAAATSIPAYASDCTGTRFSSVCSCNGNVPTVKTLPASTSVVKTTSTSISTVTSTATSTSTVTPTNTATAIVTSTITLTAIPTTVTVTIPSTTQTTQTVTATSTVACGFEFIASNTYRMGKAVGTGTQGAAFEPLPNANIHFFDSNNQVYIAGSDGTRQYLTVNPTVSASSVQYYPLGGNIGLFQPLICTLNPSSDANSIGFLYCTANSVTQYLLACTDINFDDVYSSPNPNVDSACSVVAFDVVPACM